MRAFSSAGPAVGATSDRVPDVEPSATLVPTPTTLQERMLAALEAAFAPEPAPLGAHAPVPDRLWDAALRTLLRDFLARPGKGMRAQLVEAGWCLAGRRAAALPAELPLLVELLHAGSLLVDDVQDGAELRRGAPAAHRLFGVPLAINAGGWLYFFPFALLARMPFAPPIRLALHERMSLATLQCHQGQALDLATRVTDVDPGEIGAVVDAVTRHKTAALMRLAIALGALAGDAPPSTVLALERFAERVGVALQMYDDLSGLVRPDLAHKADEDLAGACPTWPWAWLAELDGPVGYRALVAQLALGGSDPVVRAAVRARLGARVAEHGLARARGLLDEACAALDADLPPSPARTALCAAARTLESAYVRA